MGLIRLCAWMFGGLVTAFGSIQMLWPPMKAYLDQPGSTLLELVALLLDPFSNAIYRDTPLAGAIWLAAMGLIAVAVVFGLGWCVLGLLKYIEASWVPISVLETKIVLSFRDETMARATLSRTQLIHANRKVEAYRSITAVDGPKAKVLIDTYETQARTQGGKSIAIKKFDVGNERRRELFDIFDQRLPRSWFATWLPNWLVLRCRKLFQKSLVIRTTSIDQTDEFNGDRPVFQLSSVRYPITNVTIELCFFESTAPDAKDLEVFIISENSAASFTPERGLSSSTDRRVWIITRPQLKNATILITWKNRRLKLHQAAQARAARTGRANQTKPPVARKKGAQS